MNLRNALLAAAVAVAPLAAPLAANAQVVNGPYVSAGLGTSYEQQESAKGFGSSGTAKLNWGWTGNAAVGYGYGNGFRAEVEGNYINNQYTSVSGSTLPGPLSVGGQEQKYGAFINGYYDFDNVSDVVYPYLGAGVGYQFVNSSGGVHSGVNSAILSGTKGDVAAQGIAGLAFPISGVPGLSLTAEYRFQDVIGDRSYAVSYNNAPVGDIKANDAYNHSILLGLRYAFWTPAAAAPAPAPAAAPTPAPAPVAAPAPAPARTYLVFFDWDKSDLTDKAKAIIADAADASTKVQTTQIAVNGYTDLSGTAEYNQKLSVRRAEAVAGELVRLGVKRDEIDIKGFGESNPLVPTAPGVREPQNRRVEIILK
jgi:OOP family OmpA-OmpF porin